ncbi:MAG: DNA phosphorothioation-associated putative methyltransferase, partial [Deltaproteobacteria bacterium]|nr:DNA phosphorothioation-associated putative methyltransferase [Deltaproteobacteria bacterium]
SAQILHKADQDTLNGTRLGDGILTRLSTFQKYFAQKELRHYVESGLGKKAVFAGLGTFYVFRRESDRKAFQKKKRSLPPEVRAELGPSLLQSENGAAKLAEESPSAERKVAFGRPAPVVDGYQATQGQENILDELRKMVESLGRLPTLREFSRSSQLLQRFGSLQKALAKIKPYLDKKALRQAEEQQKTELLVCLVREVLRGKGTANFRRLAPERQADVRAFFVPFEESCEEAKKLIAESHDPKHIERACRTSSVGKLLPDALYVHTSALPFLPPVLRALVLRASMLASESSQSNIVKIYRSGAAVSFLAYEDFDTVAHPRLLLSIHVPFVDGKSPVIRRERSDNPPIVHRKELFVHPTYAFFQQFQQLTREEEAAGLFAQSPPGRLLDWEYLLFQKRVSVLGHRVVKMDEATLTVADQFGDP